MTKLSHEEYQMWQAYYQIEPFGVLREDFRIGQICATMANIVGDGKTTYKATDFIPTIDSYLEAEEQKSIDKMNDNLAIAFQTLKASAINKKKRVNI